MILYCDTSALVKLYIVERESEQVQERVSHAEAVAVSRLAWAEFHAALARRGREVPTDQPNLEKAKAALAADWPHYLVLDATQRVIERAGDYADLFALRAYDAVQLAAAFELSEMSALDLEFACFDIRLNRAARALRLRIPWDHGPGQD